MKYEELLSKLEERIDSWAQSYDERSIYTTGKVAGAYTALQIVRDILESNLSKSSEDDEQ